MCFILLHLPNSIEVKIYDLGEKIVYIFENSDSSFEDSKALIKEGNKVISTSLKPSVADNFLMLYGDEGVFAYIKVADVNGANISAISSGIDESEILLERGLNCKITKAWEEDGYKYVIMEISK